LIISRSSFNVTWAMVKTFQAYLPNKCHRTYNCIHCRAHLANHDELISKSFQGSQGRAYLFNSVVNVGCGQSEERFLLTGLHSVADIYCECCKTTLGWKYQHAFESAQKYKEGKFIIELAHMIKENGWEDWQQQRLVDLCVMLKFDWTIRWQLLCYWRVCNHCVASVSWLAMMHVICLWITMCDVSLCICLASIVLLVNDNRIIMFIVIRQHRPTCFLLLSVFCFQIWVT